MKHKLKISVSKEPLTRGIVTCRRINVRERLMKSLFGDHKNVMVLIPGERLKEIDICEVEEKGETNDEREAITD